MINAALTSSTVTRRLPSIYSSWPLFVFYGDIRTLADLLGHNDLKMTMRYTASTKADKAAQMAGMG
ncbi:MAG: hypothetical protein R6W69_04940 [Anaerolineales bacterium]